MNLQVWTEGDETDPIKLAAYTPDEIDDITDVIRTTMATDQENLGVLNVRPGNHPNPFF